MSLDTTMVSIHSHFIIKDGKRDQCNTLLEEILVMKLLLLTPIFKSFKKSAYMIEKVVDEIVLAKARRESDGTYSA